jgi:gamma-glutamyltranspeptidase/glutathione hydrolase
MTKPFAFPLRSFLLFGVLLSAALLWGQGGQQKGDGSPEQMEAFAKAHYAKTFKPLVRGLRGVVGGGKYLSAQAGQRVLMEGGNAVDAGVATVFAEAVTELDVFGFGGEVPVLVYAADEGKVYAISGMGIAPQKVSIDFYKQKGGIPPTGILSATVPAVFDTLVLALDRFGTMSLEQVLQPAIEYADGFPMYEHLASQMREREQGTKEFPATARIYLPGGRPSQPGEIFRQPELAATLRELVEVERNHRARGRHAALQATRDYFYRGPIAKRIGDFSQANGGLLSAEDLAAYAARIEEPVKTSYRGYEVYKVGFWTQGPFMLQTLNLLEGFDLKAMGHNSADYLHTVAEAMKLGFADRDLYYGDPDFTSVPGEKLLSKDYAQIRRKLIDPRKASLDQRPGDPRAMKPLVETTNGLPPAEASFEGAVESYKTPLGTTTANAVDRWGNLFSATPSGAWLPPVIAGDTGIPLTQRLQQALLLPGHPNELRPHKRPRITLTPGIVLKDGKPFMAWSTAGGDSQDQGLLQVLLNVVEFGMSIQEAVEAPRIYTRHLVNTFYKKDFNAGVLEIENRVDSRAIAELKGRGHRVEVKEGWAVSTSPTVVRVLPNGVQEGAADVRQFRQALAW